MTFNPRKVFSDSGINSREILFGASESHRNDSYYSEPWVPGSLSYHQGSTAIALAGISNSFSGTQTSFINDDASEHGVTILTIDISSDRN